MWCLICRSSKCKCFNGGSSYEYLPPKPVVPPPALEMPLNKFEVDPCGIKIRVTRVGTVDKFNRTATIGGQQCQVWSGGEVHGPGGGLVGNITGNAFTPFRIPMPPRYTGGY